MISVQVEIGSLAAFNAEAVIVGVFEGKTPLSAEAKVLDKALKGLLQEECKPGKPFQGKLGDTFVLHTHHLIPARYVVLVGLGKSDQWNSFTLRRASAAAIRACMRLKVKTVGTTLHGLDQPKVNAQSTARVLVEGALLGSYQFLAHKKKPSANGDNDTPTPKLETLTLIAKDAKQQVALEAGAEMGQKIAENVNLARDWVFDSSNHVTPTFLMEQAKQIAKNHATVSCKVLDQDAIAKQGMGSFAAVAQGSEAPPYLIHLTYKPKGKAKKKVALVGKGITFDSGGLSLKPPQGMELMKDDMGGAAAVLATMRAIAMLGDLNIQVDVVVPTCENMPSGRALKPGDIIRAMNGKTIEVNNTDAEGRLILCDALWYAQQEVKPDEILDLATLTGACVVALGKVASGIMGTNQALIDGIRAAGEEASEKFWQLPLYDEYKDFLKSDVADLINAGAKGEAGSSAAGMFLKEFIQEKQAWAHLDIAGPAYTNKDYPEVPKGATGVGVRTLLYYLYGLSLSA